MVNGEWLIDNGEPSMSGWRWSTSSCDVQDDFSRPKSPPGDPETTWKQGQGAPPHRRGEDLEGQAHSFRCGSLTSIGGSSRGSAV